MTLSSSSDITSGRFDYQIYQNHTVFLYNEDSAEMYVGGTDFVLQLDVNDFHIIEVGKLRFETTVFDVFILLFHLPV